MFSRAEQRESETAKTSLNEMLYNVNVVYRRLQDFLKNIDDTCVPLDEMIDIDLTGIEEEEEGDDMSSVQSQTLSTSKQNVVVVTTSAPQYMLRYLVERGKYILRIGT